MKRPIYLSIYHLLSFSLLLLGLSSNTSNPTLFEISLHGLIKVKSELENGCTCTLLYPHMFNMFFGNGYARRTCYFK